MYIGRVRKKPYEALISPLPNLPKMPKCHVDLWRADCRLWLDTTRGQFFAPPFQTQVGEYGVDDYRILQTEVITDFFDDLEIITAYLVDYVHGQITKPIHGCFGSIQRFEDIAISVTVAAAMVDPKDGNPFPEFRCEKSDVKQERELKRALRQAKRKKPL